MRFISYSPPKSFECVDDASAELILQLQLADLEDLKDRFPGKQKDGEHHDEEMAVSVFEENVRSLQALFADKRMTKSIAQAVAADGIVITEAIMEESITNEDHQMARTMGGQSTVVNPSSIQSIPKDLDDAILAKLAAAYISEDLGSHLDESHDKPDARAEGEEMQAEASAWAASRGGRPGGIDHRCVACLESKKFFDVIAAPCHDEYCRTCLRQLFEASSTDESLFPPRCCRQPIPLSDVEIFLTRNLRETFVEKAMEYSSKDRTYCHRPACSFFIGEDNITGGVAACPVCLEYTCAACKGAGHSDQDCPNDKALQAVLDLTREHGWQRCFSCGRIVELETGCNHMT